MSDFLSREPRPMWRALATLSATVYAVAFLGAQARAPRPGDPLAGISTGEFAEFRLGLDDFLEVETAEEGLGPAFNGTSCAICHNIPAVGGFGTIAELRAVGRNEEGELTPLHASGETLHQLFSVPTHGCQVSIPDEAVVIARRIPIPLFGAGLVEAIPDATLVALEDPTDGNGDGVSGRAARIVDVETGQVRIGRFGWKAQHATLLAFGADAYRNEMGITNDLFPDELASGVSGDRMRLCDPIPDPEDIRDPRTNRRGIDNFASFMRFLAPLARLTPDAAARSGEQVFTAIGCATCHVPVLTTGRNPNRLFDESGGRAVFGPAPARHRHGRRHCTGCGAFDRNPHAGAVGSQDPPAVPARRVSDDDRTGDRAPRGGSRAHACRVRPVDRSRQSGAARVPEDAVRPRRLSRPPDR